MDVMAGYKRTEVGVIPEDWEVATAAQVCELIVDCKNRTPPVVEGGEFAVVRTPNVRNGKFVREDLRYTDERSFGEWTARAVPQIGDVLITREAPLGEVCLVPDDLRVCLGQRMMLYRPDREKTDTAFLLYALMSTEVQTNLLKKIGGSTVGHAKVNDLRNLQVPLPQTRVEQEAIAKALGDADALIESLEQLVGKKHRIKQGTMRELLTGKQRLPDFQPVDVRVRETEIGKLPSDWDVVDVAEVTLRHKQGFYTKEQYVDNGTRLVRITDLMDDTINFSKMPMLKVSKLEFDQFKIDCGDFLFARSGAIGRYGIVHDDIDAVFGSYIIRFVFNHKRISNEYFGYVYQTSLIWKQLLSITQGSSNININAENIKSLKIPLPSRAEQDAITTVLVDMDSEIAALEVKLAKYRRLKQGMMHKLLTGKIRLVDPGRVKVKPVPAISEGAAPTSSDRAHTWAFNEAVIISVLADQFGEPAFPLGRKRYTKLSYLIHRKAEKEVQGYLKKAAGPCNPKTKYAGPEKIAQENGYVRRHENGRFKGFIAAEKIEQAKTYFAKWYGPKITSWLEQFRSKSNDQLECLATVDMAIQELLTEDRTADVKSVRALIASEPDWLPKLERPVFSDSGIAAAITECHALFG